MGLVLRRWLEPLGWQFVVLSRNPGPGDAYWDGKSLGPWQSEIDRADVVIDLAGKSVNCRYNAANLRQMMDSRVDSTRVVGQAISASKSPPRVWLQASTATIYAHRFDAPNDESTGIIGGAEPGAPPKWTASINVAKAWEAELDKANTPSTRKVALRSAMTMAIDEDSVFYVLAKMAKRGMGGTVGSGRQFVSWIHERDFARAIQFLVENDDLSGSVNVCSPNPLPNKQFAEILRAAVGVRFGPPIPIPALELGTLLMGTESELVLKSRRVVPARLLEAGFKFEFPEWEPAARELAERMETK